MSNTFQYLDYDGLRYYDRKLKESLKDYMPKDGVDGVDGQDGLTPTIGLDGYWYIGDKKTEYKAAGKDGVDGAPGQDGQDGTSITITSNSKVDGVTTVTFSDGNTIKINDADDADLQLTEKIVTNVACGALDSGQTLKAGLSLTDIVKLLTTTVYRPSKGSNPSATLTMKNQSGSNYASVVEIGTTIRPILTPRFNDGTFNTYDKGTTVSRSMNAGCVAKDYTISRNSIVGKTTTSTKIFDYSDPEDPTPDFGEESKYTDSHKIGAESISYTIKIDYAESTNHPTNSNGEQDTSLKYAGGSADNGTAASTTTSTISVGLYNFHKKGNLTVNDGDIINANGDIEVARTKTITENDTTTTIQNLTNGNLVINSANIDYGVYTTIPTGVSNLLGDKSYFFVPATGTVSCPSNKKYKLMADDEKYYPQNNATNRITGWYKLGVQDGSGNWSDLVVKIKDAGSTLRDYHVYKYKADTPYTDPAFLRFSCVSKTTSEASSVNYQNKDDFFTK